MIRKVFVGGKPYLLDEDGIMLPPVMGGQEVYGPPVPSDYVPPVGSQTPPGGVYDAVTGQPPGTPIMPNPDDYWVKMDSDPNSLTFGQELPASPGEAGAWQNVYSYNKDLADYLEFGTPGGPGGPGATTGPTAAELAIEQSKVQAANMANYLDGVIRGVEAEISAGRLSLEQAEAEFNRRMDALGEAGTQMAAMWQWTVPEDAGALHPDIRANLGMEPWESQPMTWDPYALAQQIIAETPELTGQPIATDPIQEAIELAQGLI